MTTAGPCLQRPGPTEMNSRPSPLRGLAFDEMAVGLLFVAIAVLALFTPAQSDTFWHLRAGADIWRTGQVPRVDLYSHTAYGTPWPDHEWLSQVLMYAAYRAGGGMPGLEVGAALLILAAALTVYRLMVGPRTTRFAIMTVGLGDRLERLVVAAPAPDALSSPGLVWLLARERYLLIPPFFLLWANAHGGVALGGVVLGVCAAAATLRSVHTRAPADRRRAFRLAAVLPLAALAVAATPLGFHIYRFVVASAARSYQVQIAEWFVLRPDSLFGVLFWIATIAFAVLLIARRRAIAAGDWADWVVVAAGLALLPLGIRSARNIGPFLILAMPAASRAFGSTFRFRLSRRPRPPSPDHPCLNLALLLGLGAAALVVVGAGWRASPPRLYWNPIPPPRSPRSTAARGRSTTSTATAARWSGSRRGTRISSTDDRIRSHSGCFARALRSSTAPPTVRCSTGSAFAARSCRRRRS